MSPYEPRLVDSVGFPVVLLTPLAPTTLSSPLLQNSLHLFLSAAVFDDSWGRPQFVCFWAIHLLGPGPADSVKGGLPHMVWVSNWTSYWLATPTISAPPLPQHIL